MDKQNPPTLGCGRCGYAVRGVSTTQCPECGADLTEVGITHSQAKGRLVIFALLTVLGFSVVVYALTMAIYLGLALVLPTYEDRYYSIQIEPLSQAYEELGLHIDAELVRPASGSYGAGASVSPISGPMQTVTMCDPGTNVTVTHIDIFFDAKRLNGVSVTPGTVIGIDPATRQANWVDPKGKRHTTQGAFTDQDLLACFAAHRVDTSRPDVQLEAKQIQEFMNGFMDGKNQLTLSAFTSFGYGGGATGTTGPVWFTPVYITGWLTVWFLGVVWLTRRTMKNTL